MKDLKNYVQDIFNEGSLESKKSMMQEMIHASHATDKTKKLSLLNLSKLKSNTAVDSFAVNYMMSGMGMKVS